MAEELATPKNEIPCRGGFETRPYAWTFTIKKLPASLTGQRPLEALFGKSRRKDKIIDGQYNSD